MKSAKLPPAIRGVTFDLWATLMHSTRETSKQREELRAERMQRALIEGGRERSLDEVRTASHEIWQWLERTYWDHDVDPGFEAQIEWLRLRFAIQREERALLEQVVAGFVNPIFDVPPAADPAALDTLRRTRGLGLKVGLICNTSVTPGSALRTLLAEWGLAPLLDVQLYSCELGIRKPAREIFDEAARQMGIELGQMLHVGDHEVNDIQGATKAGASAIRVGPDEPLARVSGIIASKLNT